MTRQEMDDRLLDYLYDELELSARTAFERSLPAHPEVAQEVEAHRATRQAYQALPREVAPAGLLADVLAEADREAARRAKAKANAAAAPVGILERLRRVIFQPAFAMAMVVMVVAGVSLVGTRKGAPLSIAPASDAQHIPPVAVNEARGAKAEAPAAPVAAALAAAEDEGGALAKGAEGDTGAQGRVLRDGLVAHPSATAPTTPVAPTGAADTMFSREAARGPGRLPELKPSPDPARSPAPIVATTPKAENAFGEGFDDETKKTLGPMRPELAAGSAYDGDANGVADKESVDDLARDDADRRRRNTNTVEPAPRAPLEKPQASPAPSEEDYKSVRPTEVAERPADKGKEPSKFADVASAPAPTPLERRVDAPRVATKDSETNRGGVVVPKDASDAAKRDEPVEVKRNENMPPPVEPARETTTVDRGDSGADKPATLTPPAPSSDKLWATYQQQTAAGAYADALRSIEALAKLEGETTRVKDARGGLKKKLEVQPQPAGTNKLPPDPPVQAPK